MEYRTGDDLLPSRGSERKIKPKEFLREQADHRSAAESFWGAGDTLCRVSALASLPPRRPSKTVYHRRIE